MRRLVWFGVVATACATACATADMPPMPPGWAPPKPKALVVPEPTAIYHINPGPTAPVVLAVDTNNNMLLTVPRNAPQVFIPNKTQALFALFQSNPDLSPGNWTTLDYFTNFEGGFILVDLLATNRAKGFYRLVPQ